MVVLAADLASKTFVVARYEGDAPFELVPRVLSLNVIRNAGAAFGVAGGWTILLSLIAVGVAVAILRTARRLYSLPWAVALGLLLGGAAGNLTDRLFRSPGVLRGHVVDFLELPNWPVFNLADCAIVLGGALAVVLAVRGRHLDGTSIRDQRPADPPADPPAQPPDRPGAPPG